MIKRVFKKLLKRQIFLTNKRMKTIFMILLAVGGATSDFQCGSSITNCESCFTSDANCGWCNDNLECYVGHSDGPLNHTCADWVFKFDMKCHLQSVNPVPLGFRIGVIVFCSLIAFGTLVFWICIYPKCCSPKSEEDPTSEYQPR